MENVKLMFVGVVLMLFAMLRMAEAFAQSTDEDDSFLSALEESCQQNLVSPLGINRLDAKTLAESGVFTQWQSDIIVNYRKESGAILSALELAALLGWDGQAAEILENYIDFSVSVQRRNKFEAYSGAKGRLFNNWGTEKEEKGYVGLPIASNLRVKGSVNSSSGSVWEYGTLATNSRGEKLADFISAFVSYTAAASWQVSGANQYKRISGTLSTVHVQDSCNTFSIGSTDTLYFMGARDFESPLLLGRKGVKLQKLVMGDFSARFGQGLTVWSTKGWNNFGSSSQNSSGSYCKRGNVISGRNASSEDGLLRGIAASVSLFNRKLSLFEQLSHSQSITLSAFVSYSPKDARLKDGFYTNLLSGGQHNTESLLSAKNTVNELSAGVRLELSGIFAGCRASEAASGFNRPEALSGHRMHVNSLETSGGTGCWNFKIGLNAVTWFLDRYNAAYYGEASVAEYKKYQQFNDRYADLSLDLYLTHKQWIFYSETAVDAGGSMAFLAGFSTTLADWNLAAHTHFYSRSYIAPYSGAVSASGGTSNQRVLALNVQRNFHYRWTFSMAAATVYFPWVKYQFPYHQQWNIIKANLALKLTSSNYSLQLGIKDICPVESYLRPVKNAMEKYAKTQVKAGLNAVFVLSKTGVNGSAGESSIGLTAAAATCGTSAGVPEELPENGTGGGIYAKSSGISWHLQCKLKLPLALSVEAGVFECQDWDGRMYAYGYQLPYMSSSRLLYGSGWHWEGILKFDAGLWRALGAEYSSCLNHFQLYARLSGINYWKNGLNSALDRKNTCEASFGVRFSIK